MKRLAPTISALLALTLCCAGPVRAQGKGKTGEFNLAKTQAFIREIDSRPDFPVSMVLANDYVYSMRALGEKIAPPRRNAVISWLKITQQKSGGFSFDKSGSDQSVLNTRIAMETLWALDAGNAVDTGKVTSYLAGFKNADGGFGFSPQSRASSLPNTFFAIRVLDGLKAIEVVDKAKTIAYVRSFEKKGGGFGATNSGNGGATPINTYMASYILNTLGAMNEATRQGALRYLNTTPYAKGKKGGDRPTLDDQLYAVMALRELKAVDRIDQKFALAFLRRLYIKANGGFGPIEGYGSTPDSTATGLRVLADIGKLKGAPRPK